MDELQRVWVIGGGTMGRGIAQVCAQAGLRVTLCDSDPAALETARERIRWSLGKLLARGRIEGSLEEIMARITFRSGEDWSGVQEAELVVEAVFEDRELKREIFARLDEQAAAGALLASNTSAIPITELAAATRRPARVVGLHFFNPVPLMRAVEVVRGMCTSDEAFERARAFVRRLGKEPIAVLRDVPGFLINRINLPSTIEAMRLVEQGVATVEEIDKGVRLALGRKMGIFETGDMVGLDVTYGALLALYEETRDPRWYPPLILRRKVKAGHLGRKTGKGWYEYPPEDQSSRQD
jgi:3-hydroxybutyryl-CoA dehydrogenase